MRVVPLVFLIHLLTRVAWADGDAGCDGNWSLWNPLPDACLAPIETDRPHLTDSPNPIAPGHFQLESGPILVAIGKQAPQVRLFDQMYKVGLWTGIDLQLLIVHAQLGRDQGFHPNPATLRAKVVLRHAQGARPAVTLVPAIDFPVNANQAWQAGGFVFLAWDLPRDFELEVNAGALIGQRPRQGTLTLSGAITHPLFGPLAAYSELFSTSSPTLMATALILGAGLTLAVHRDVQLDAGSLFGLVGTDFSAAPFVGFSLRI